MLPGRPTHYVSSPQQNDNENTYISATNVPIISELSGVEATALDIMADDANAGQTRTLRLLPAYGAHPGSRRRAFEHGQGRLREDAPLSSVEALSSALRSSFPRCWVWGSALRMCTPGDDRRLRY